MRFDVNATARSVVTRSEPEPPVPAVGLKLPAHTAPTMVGRASDRRPGFVDSDGVCPARVSARQPRAASARRWGAFRFASPATTTAPDGATSASPVAIALACMHFFGVFMQVHFETARQDLRGLAEDEMPSLRQSLREHWPTLIPLALLIFILVSGRTPQLNTFSDINAVPSSG